MAVIHRGRFVLAGLAAGVVMNAVTFLASSLYAAEMFAILHAHDFTPPRGPVPVAVYLLMRFTWGFVVVWFYTTARARHGPGMKTAALVGFVFWLGGIFLAVVSYGMLGLFPTSMLAQWATITLVALMLSSLVGAWIYRED